MLWIDPQLSNNSELERCLVAWEEAWELGQIFLLHLDAWQVVKTGARVGEGCGALKPNTLASTFEGTSFWE